MRFWRQDETRYEAIDVDAMKKTDFTVHGFEEGTMYEMRVLGYSRGGEGLASSPIIQFVLGPNCYVREGIRVHEFLNAFTAIKNASYSSVLCSKHVCE